MKRGKYKIFRAVGAVVEVGVALENIVVVLVGDFDTGKVGLEEGMDGEVVKVGIGVSGGVLERAGR